MSKEQLVDHVLDGRVQYSRTSLTEAINDHARDADGVLTRLHVGLFRLRRPTDQTSGGKRVARDWVLVALHVLVERVGRSVTRSEVERELATMGLRYSQRAVNKGLTDLVRDPRTAVTMTVGQRYRLTE